MISHFPASRFAETRWRNGRGLSWEIASEPAGNEDFDWRLALARIDGDAPFSHYPGVDRVFMLIDGNGLDLEVEGLGILAVHERFIPHRFAGDAVTSCRVRASPCMALNLFLRRGRRRAEIRLLRDRGMIEHHDTALLYALEGNPEIGGTTLPHGDAAQAEGPFAYRAGGGLLYAALLHRTG